MMDEEAGLANEEVKKMDSSKEAKSTAAIEENEAARDH